MALTRRELMLAAAPAAFAQKKDAAAPRPNIVLVLADDLPAWMLGCYGNKEIRTPNIDLLARLGTRFDNHFVCTPICSASRATLFTGRTPRQHGIHDFLTAKPIEQPPQGQQAPPPSFAKETMVCDLLAQAGYNCGYVGKWHMGGDAKPQHGYTHWFTFAGFNGGSYQDCRMYRDGQAVEEKGYLADVITKNAVEFLDKQTADKPFFLTISHCNPHVPLAGHPQKYYDMYAQTSFDTVGWEPPAAHALREKELLKDTVGNIRRTAAATTALDDQIPPVLAKLRQKGLWDNTLFVFTGDNGFLLGRHGLWSKGLASDPINMYEEVMRVPLICVWPGKVPVQIVRPELVSFYDFLPTVCEAAGVTPPAGRNLPGRSYLTLAQGKPLPKKEPWRTYVFGHFRNTEMARDSRYKVVVRDGGKGPGELYDLRQDPREKTNHYENPSFVVTRQRLEGELAKWRAATSA